MRLWNSIAIAPGVTAGLTFPAVTVQPQAGLTLPSAGSVSTNGTAFSVTNTGSGDAVLAYNSGSGDYGLLGSASYGVYGYTKVASGVGGVHLVSVAGLLIIASTEKPTRSKRGEVSPQAAPASGGELVATSEGPSLRGQKEAFV